MRARLDRNRTQTPVGTQYRSALAINVRIPARIEYLAQYQNTVATSINLIQAQRLIRRICSECKEETHVPIEGLIEIGFSKEEAKSLKLYKGRGCDICLNTGFKGRVGLYEVMEVTDDLRELIIIGASAIELRRKAIELGMITLRGSGLCKLREGITTIEEVVKETVA